MDKLLDYIEKNQDRFLDELKEFIRFPSVSKHSHRKEETRACAKWLADHLQNLGLQVRLIETNGHPIVRAEAKGKVNHTVMIYGHYDVQPEEPLELWKTPPFEATIQDGFIYARGATDDKGQLFAHIKGVEALLKTQGELPCNLLFLIEGEEEGGGDGLKQYICNKKDEINVDSIIVSDGNMYGDSTPAICYGLRGIVALELIIKSPNQDLHSGTFGGAVANSILVLSRILAQCQGPDGKITIPGFYDDVRPVEDWEVENLKKLQFDETNFKEQTGIKETFGEPGYSVLEQTWSRPTFEANGIYGGYAGEGGKTIIPAYAGVKITLRLVPNMDARKVGQIVKDYLVSLIPPYVDYEFHGPSGSNAVIFDTSTPIVQAGKEALQTAYGKEAVFIREGGSISVVKTMFEELHKPFLLIGFGTDQDGMHSPNERFAIENFIRGIKTSAVLLSNLQR